MVQTGSNRKYISVVTHNLKSVTFHGLESFKVKVKSRGQGQGQAYGGSGTYDSWHSLVLVCQNPHNAFISFAVLWCY